MESSELLPRLPEELGLECLYRLPYSAYRVATPVCRRWSQLLQSLGFFQYRRKNGYTHHVACLVQALDGVGLSSDRRKAGSCLGTGVSPSFGITAFDEVSRTWERIDPVPEYPNGLPLFCRLASCDGKLVVMGGWDPVTYDPVTRVFIYNFTMRRWRRGKEMPSKRSFFAVGAHEGLIYVAGGHDENKNGLKAGSVYDLRRDEWTELPPMSQERDECEGVVIGDEFWVVSGYRTDQQGAFDGSAEVYNLGSGEWRRVENAWEAGRCPRSCSVGKDGKLVSWADLCPMVRVGACGVVLGSRVLVSGSEQQGGAQGFYMVEMNKDGGIEKLERINVADEFLGFVQSGCCVEI